MQTKSKVLITVLVALLILIGIIIYLSYLGLSADPERLDQLKSDAQSYLDENYDETMTVVDAFYDNASIYSEFSYAAIAEIEGNDRFRILVFEYLGTGEMTDSIVAETWEYELETYLSPKIDDAFGENSLQELWVTYPKDIGYQLGIDNIDNIPSLKGQNAYPTIRITLNRGEEDEDEEQLEALIDDLKNDLQIENGSVTLIFNDNALIFKDKNIRKDI